MHLVIATVGTRGDVQPYVAVGRGLKDAGHEVSVIAHPEYERLVESQGLKHVSLEPSMRSLVDSDLGRRWLESGPHPLRYVRLTEALFAGPVWRWLQRSSDVIAELRPDAVLGYPLALMQCLPEVERRRLPTFALPPWPGYPTKAGHQPMLPAPSALNRPSWDVFSWLFCRGFMEPHQRFRREGDLRPLRRNPLRAMWRRRIPFWHLLSPLVYPRPRDWPQHADVIGYAFLDRPDYEPPPELASFVEDGEPPIAIGFGSMMTQRPAQLSALLSEALEATGVRAVLVGGWSEEEVSLDGDRVLSIRDVPHDWLFPRCRAVVHHGGAGTTAAALRAGKPAAVMSFFGDQPFWARRLHALGVAPPPLDRGSVTAAALTDAIRAIATDSGLTRTAERAAAQIAREDGVRETVRRLSAHLHD